MSEIRRLVPGDIPEVMRLNRAASWNQVEQDWLRLLELEPEGCFGADCNGRIVATATAVCYGSKLAWIGMVLTDPDFRGRGFGRALTECAIRYADERQIEWIKLDATDMGRPIYLRLGFEDERPIERWRGPATGRWDFVSRATRFQLDAALDAAAFGTDRSRLLMNLAQGEAFSIPGEGFVMARPGASAFSLGPCVARSPGAARDLISSVLAMHPGGPYYWDLLPANTQAVGLAREFGFTPARKLVRMVRRGVEEATPLRFDESLVYAAAGFEYG
jgi:GNAT superfamily N-acetyltransferase